MSDLMERLEQIFSDLMPDEIVPIRERTRTRCANWDSLLQLNLIVAVEQEFQTVISDDEAVDINSFESVQQILEEKFSDKEGQNGRAL